VNDDPVPGPRRDSRYSILPIISLVPQMVHTRLKLGSGSPGLARPVPLLDAAVNVVNVVSLPCGQLPIFPRSIT
jgi:hypothetical protein